MYACLLLSALVSLTPCFHAPFDGTAEAVSPHGGIRPLEEEGLSYCPGRTGKAVQLSSRAHSRLAYAIDGALNRDAGTVMMWVRRDWDLTLPEQPFRSLFAFPQPTGPGDPRKGSGALWFWWQGAKLRGDQSDPGDRYVQSSAVRLDADWHHVAFAWKPNRTQIFADGKLLPVSISDKYSPLAQALQLAKEKRPDRSGFTRFFIGNRSGREILDGAIDELEIYDTALSEEDVRNRFVSQGGRLTDAVKPDYGRIVAAKKVNPYEGPAAKVPGTVDGKELVDEVVLSPLPGPTTFRFVGNCTTGSCDGTSYLDAGPNSGDRFAVRFKIPEDITVCRFEIDYPDNALRTADIIVQPAQPSCEDYAAQVGYATGDEYPNSNRIATHALLYWPQPGVRDVALVIMTARQGQNAAASAIRLYRLCGNSLPAAGRPPMPPQKNGWGRSVACYFEDPALNFEFGIPPSHRSDPESFADEVERLAATMKFTGENLLCYPAVWYQGRIGPHYNPRNHAPEFWQAIFSVFDREDLQAMPTINFNNLPGLANDFCVTLDAMTNGTLHTTEIAIHNTGLPNWGKWHDTPPNYNFTHPHVQAELLRQIDAILADGKSHPSFKGIVLHLTKHCLAWFGDESSGYNDYTVQDFSRDTGIAVPCNPTDPLRGKAMADWIRANCRPQWIQWRCDRVTDFYAQVASRLSRTRPDLKLMLNSFVPADYNHPNFNDPDYLEQANRASGLDRRTLTSRIPNLILCQTMVPADYRWAESWRYKDIGRRNDQRDLERRPGFYSLVSEAVYPWVNQHDRYWESPIGRTASGKKVLSGDWLKEFPWRVTTINPAGVHVLRHFAEPFRHTDILGLSKGGFLIGTYGSEEHLASFFRAFRTLPPVRMSDTPDSTESVKVRSALYLGRRYAYVINTTAAPTEIEVGFPAETCDILTHSRVPQNKGRVTIKLTPYQLRTFLLPE